MSKYRIKFKAINPQIVPSLAEVINELEQQEQLELEQTELENLEQFEHIEQLAQLSNNQNSIFYRLNPAQTHKSDYHALMTLLLSMLYFTLALCNEDYTGAMTGLLMAFTAFLFKIITCFIDDAIENNNRGYIYQSHYRNG
ncbi:Uncharacterised protein [Legionella wadsworthii]|uniref:Uncharacterized protein n=1 Tax=Legionella wadsworthii TaxID=28088 RepID=A0A378LXT7_9GAMM|nr:hypothetical protein [Legionella wadsworthii]STY31428.1 Uncharacterised protein [Legionella wadsworthii]